MQTDNFLNGLDALGLLLWCGDVQAMRAGVAKVLDGHRRLLAQVRQGEVAIERCVVSQQTLLCILSVQRPCSCAIRALAAVRQDPN